MPSRAPQFVTSFALALTTQLPIGSPVASGQSCISPPDGIVSWWSMDDLVGGIAEDITNGNPGTLMNGASAASGISMGGLALDGIDDYVLVPDSPNLRISDELTIEGWIKLNAFSDDPGRGTPILHKDPQNTDRAYYVNITPTGFVDFAVFGDGTGPSLASLLSSVSLTLGVFEHVACVYKGGPSPTIDVYINGVVQNGELILRAGSIPPQIHVNTHPVFIGAYVAGDHPFPKHLHGVIDEVTIYNRALSATEITAIHNAGSLGKCKTSDTDGDGLDDDVEIAIGTDPLDPDTDGDGLLDWTEVDIAGGAGCPDPLNADSDGDTLLDGDEVTAGTDLCNADTDADGIPDPIDPFPLDPGGTSGFVEEKLRAMCDSVASLDLDLIEAPNSNAAAGRRNAICNKLQAAANATAAGDFAEAIDQILSLRQKVDGDPLPADWMVTSPDRDALAADLDTLLVLLDLLS